MKVLLVVATSGCASAGAWSSPPDEVLAALGSTHRVMPSAWVVTTPATEREALAHVRASCDDGVDVVVVRLDLGGYAAHLRSGRPLSSWWDADALVSGR